MILTKISRSTLSLTVILLLSFLGFSQNNGIKEISGVITFQESPLKDVNIIIKGTTKGTKTDTEGNYSIRVNVGDELQYSYVGFNTVRILVEDVTTVLNIEMDNYVTKLDEVVVDAESNASENAPGREYNRKIKTSKGNFNPMLREGARYFSHNRIGTQYRTLSEALKFYYPKGLPTENFDVDGVFHQGEPYVDMASVRDIYYFPKSKYLKASEPLIIIRTTNSEEYREERSEKNRNQNYYSNDAIALNDTIPTVLEDPNDVTGLKKLNGKITYLDKPLPDVNIRVLGTRRGTTTDKRGKYTLNVRKGETVQYSYVGFSTIDIIVEDITSTLDLKMIEKSNLLKEAIVTARKNQSTVSEIIERMDVNLDIPGGIFNPLKSGLAVSHMPSDRLNTGSPTLVAALSGKFAGLSSTGLPPTDKLLIRGGPALYVLDGITYDEPPPIPLSQIEDIYIIKLSGLVVIVPKYAPHLQKIKQEKIAEEHRNQNYYSNDAVSLDGSTTVALEETTLYGNFRKINGKITHLDAPLADVNISILGSNRGTSTNNKGKYTLKARAGETVQFSYVGFKTVSIVIEDITKELNIEMITNTNELDEVVVIARTTEGEVQKRSAKAEESFDTSRGSFNPKTAGFAVGYVDGNELSNGYGSILEGLVGKISGYSVKDGKGYIRGANSSINQDYPVGWEVDGVFTSETPVGLDLSQIESVHALKTLAATNKYGTLGAGGVIIIKTKFGNFNNASYQKVAEQFTNKDFYSNDATALTDNLFIEDISIGELVEQANTTNNPEVLKRIAYQYQALGLRAEAIELYEKVFTLRPKYAQSYRDLANAYIENDQFTKGWRLYMSYLMQGNDVSGEGIGQIIYNEMEYLYFNRQNQTPIRETFQPKNETIDEFRNDVRIVFEWNSSEAEFDLEFVSPDRRAYTFNHSLASNQELITDEKLKGYSSKEFTIDDIGNGEWLINFTYKGNKKPEPTFFKVTTYYHWGKSAQKQEIKVYQFEEERHKIQLMRLNKQLLLVNR